MIGERGLGVDDDLRVRFGEDALGLEVVGDGRGLMMFSCSVAWS